MGYAAMTSPSARRMASAMASQPVTSASTSICEDTASWTFSTVVAMSIASRRGRLVRADGREAGHLGEPLPVLVRLLLVQHELVLVVGELQLVDHHDAVLHRAHLRADPAADAGLVDHLVVTRGRDLEALVGTVQPAHRALDACIEIHHRAEGARRVLLVEGVALAGLPRLDDDALAHLGPAGLLELQLLVRIGALADLDLARAHVVVAELHRRDPRLV